MAYPVHAEIDTIRTTAFGSIGASFTSVGSIVDKPTRLFYVFNDTDATLYISDDGVNNKFKLPSGAFIVLDITANKIRDDGLFLRKNRYWYVKHAGVAPTSGSIDITLIGNDNI